MTRIWCIGILCELLLMLCLCPRMLLTVTVNETFIHERIKQPRKMLVWYHNCIARASGPVPDDDVTIHTILHSFRSKFGHGPSFGKIKMGAVCYATITSCKLGHKFCTVQKTTTTRFFDILQWNDSSSTTLWPTLGFAGVSFQLWFLASQSLEPSWLASGWSTNLTCMPI